MIDNKIYIYLTNTSSSMKCYICNASSKQMNDINSAKTRNSKNETLFLRIFTRLNQMFRIFHID